MANIKDVAKLAGVATSTVSKVLNGYQNISQKTRDKVHDVAQQLGYVANQSAVALSSKSYHRIGFIISVANERHAIDEISMQYILGAINKSKELAIAIEVIFLNVLENMSVDEIIATLKADRITSIVTYGVPLDHKINAIIDRQVFYAVCVDSNKVNAKTSSLAIWHRKAIYEVAKKTIKGNYCKKLLFIAGQKNIYSTEEKILGLKRLQEKLGFELVIKYANLSEKKAREFTFEYGEEADVIICASDLMSIGVNYALKEMDIFRPVSGYDGISLMCYIENEMYTVKQDFYQLAQSSITEIARLMHSKPSRFIYLDYCITKLYYQDVLNLRD